MIFYFTGTGNSLYAAKKIHEELDHEIIDISMALENQKYSYTLSDHESIGFVIPVYYYGVPSIVEDFINNINLEYNGNPFIFSVMTCGASIGGADRMLRGLLKKRNLELSAVYSLPMVDNFIFGYDLADPSDQVTALSNAQNRMKYIIKSLQVQGTSSRSSTILDRMLTSIAYPLYRNGRKTKKFFSDDKCTSCSLCEEICPIKAIKMVEGKPKWIKEQCVHCVACINRCPENAIQYGTATKKRRRYVHPVMK